MPHAQELLARKRRLSNGGRSFQHRTHTIIGTSAVGVTPLVTDDLFPDRLAPIFFEVELLILSNAGVHRGLIFEFGSSTRGAAAWVGDETIGLTAGGLTTEQAVATWNNGAELGVGRIFKLTLAISPGEGLVRIYDRGIRLESAVASGGDFNGDWADTDNGSFALALVGTVAQGVPVASQITPNGFAVVGPLRVFAGSKLTQLV